jgi:ABC-type antimicrobial peptide transport system permease subunit
LLAALGIYGVLSQTVAEREREIGIRMALGASAPDIVLSVLGRMLILTCGGIAAGWGLSLLFSDVLASVLFGVGPVDPGAFLGTACVLLGVAALAAGLPARRAASTEASRVLKAQ